MENQNNKIQRDLARALRKNMTSTEVQLWEVLRKRQMDGFRFRRQFPLGRYVADFVCLEARLVIELDGKQHLLQQVYDHERDQWMKEQGFQVLRFWNHQITDQRESVLQTIRKKLYQHS